MEPDRATWRRSRTTASSEQRFRISSSDVHDNAFRRTVAANGEQWTEELLSMSHSAAVAAVAAVPSVGHFLSNISLPDIFPSRAISHPTPPHLGYSPGY